MINFIQEYFGVITLSIALLGAVLGIVNTIDGVSKSRRDRKYVVKVTPKLGYRIGGGIVSSSVDVPNSQSFLVVKVLNQSHFPIYVDGLYLTANPAPKGRIAQLLPSPTTTGKELPCKLDRNESVTLFAEDTTVNLLKHENIVGAYIETACGKKFSGTSIAIQAIHAKA